MGGFIYALILSTTASLFGVFFGVISEDGSGEFVIPSFLAFLSTLGLGNIAGIMIYYIFPLTLSIACHIYESPLKLWWSRTSGTLVAAFCVGWFIGAASVSGADVFSF